jgi:tetratricopeptide (TPR) repeat protein
MAKEEKGSAQPEPPAFSDADKARARQWFKKAADCRERREYDYAIECFINGLGYWPEAVEEGHMLLRSVAIQRQQVGGKKPTMMDGLKKPMTGKDPKQCMFNAEHLLSMDPANGSYAEGMLKNAIKAGYLETVRWVAPLVFEALKKDKKPNKARFKTCRDGLVEAAALAESRGEAPMETWLLEQAVNSIDYLVARMPGDDELRNEQRDLAGRLTIARGRYDHAEDFRESLQDADKQKLLHDSDRIQQSDTTLDALIAAARREWQAAPETASKINTLVEVLLRAERRVHENEAIQVLTQAFEKTRNYSFKSRADDVRLRQLGRVARRLELKARQSKSEDDQQQARLAAMEHQQVELEIFRERVVRYPTDLRMKFDLGRALFKMGEYDEAIPALQTAQDDPRSRVRCQLLIGRSFFEKGNLAQAVEVLRDAIDHYELTDERSKELLYWLGRSHEAAGSTDEARAAYGKLLRQDYNYMDGDARKRMEGLK